MTTMWGSDEVSIRELLRDLNDSALALPQFQRQSVWTGANWIPFLLSVLKGRPTGTLLLLQCKEGRVDFAPRNLDTAPPLDPKKTVTWLLLDGQQRLTTLYRAFFSSFTRGQGPNHYDYVIDIKAALAPERQELLEEDFTLTKGGDIGGFAELAEKGLVTLKVLYDPPIFENWKTAYTSHHLAPQGKNVGDLRQAFDEVMGGATSVPDYKFPVLKIDRETPLDVVVDIFEGMNRRGQKLNQFDLMVARLYKPLPDGTHYNLRSRWEEELEDSPKLKSLGITEDDGMLPLQLIAKQVSRLDPPLCGRVKGLNNKDVLELEPQQVIGGGKTTIPDLSQAVKALESAAEFLHRVCGVRSALLPQRSMLLPIADQYLRSKKKQLDEGQLRKWFFCVGLRGHYHGSVNSYANSDCDDLTKWAEGHDVPVDISGFTKRAVNGLDLRQANTREAAITGNSIMSLLIATGALDWDDPAIAVKDLKDDVELHHVVPAKRLKKMLSDGDPTNPIAGLTPITKSSNLRLGDDEPGTVIRDLDKQATQIMQSHKVNEQLLSNGYHNKTSYEAFLKDREKQLKKMLVQTLGLS